MKNRRYDKIGIEAENLAYGNTAENLRAFLTYGITPSTVKDKLIVMNYLILTNKAHKIAKKNIDTNFFVWDYLSTEEWIAYRLSSSIRECRTKKETKKVTAIMKTESEIIKRKLKEIKEGTATYEEENKFRERLADYESEEFIDKILEGREKIQEADRKVMGAKEELDKVLDKHYENNIIDINTRKPVK